MEETAAWGELGDLPLLLGCQSGQWARQEQQNSCVVTGSTGTASYLFLTMVTVILAYILGGSREL